MENSKENMPCNCGTFSYNFLIKFVKVQIVLKTLLFTMMTKIEQLEELQKNCKSMGHWDPICPSAARKSTAADVRPAQVDFVSFQMETLQKILKSNGTYGPPKNNLFTIAA
jgi:hypothetical protein